LTVSRTRTAAPAPAGGLATTIFQHRTQVDWGAACIAWEREGKRGYQFEDGHVRVFNAAYDHLLEAIDVPRERADSLMAMAGRASAPPTAAVVAGASLSITLDQQFAYLRATYPDGFSGQSWRCERRRHAVRNLKRHRDPAIARAREQLARPQLDAWIAGGRALQGVTALRDLLDSTDLVGSAALKHLGQVDLFGAVRLLTALRDLLWGELPFGRRFEPWVAALGRGDRTAGWAMATAPLALVHPADHVCVTPVAFRAQAAWLAPELQLGSEPQTALYERALRMVAHIHAAAIARGLAPADLLDVHDFIGLSLGPRARAVIATS
jgi:hypothetical protein